MVAFKFENETLETRLPPKEDTLSDIRFRKLLSQTEWHALPQAVKHRFGERIAGGQSKLYQGHITKNEMSRLGFIMAQILRVVGAPLPTEKDGIGVPAIVTVTEDKTSSGQFWIRQYGRKKTFPQIIHSTKRFAGPTGLEEYIGYGIGMTLVLKVIGADLIFQQHKYFLEAFGRRVYIPDWMTPGALTITHVDLGKGWFEFGLTLKHKLFGCLLDQKAEFRDVAG